MKDTGIIMSGDHTKLILDGLKVMTRRVIKPCSPATLHDGSRPDWVYTLAKCPYGQVGDRLWVRETWATEKRLDKYSGAELGNAAEVALWFKANEIPSVSLERGRWRSSRFMCRWASRISLEITEVRVERVQEISYEDCYAEGIDRNLPRERKLSALVSQLVTPKTYFKELWDSLNAKRGYGWVVNPWVWVISFKKC